MNSQDGGGGGLGGGSGMMLGGAGSALGGGYGGGQAAKRKGQSNDPECRLDYVCEQLGVTRSTCHTVTEIDVVLDDLCRMDFVQWFPNVRNLILINQGISEIEGMDKLQQLDCLWLNENLIETIKGFDKLGRNLLELHLGNNRIRRIRGLDALVILEKLWLDENRIESIGEGSLNSLAKLRELNLASNRIESIGMSLDGLVSLEELNISNNKIGNFKEVLNLNRLPNLRICTFQDPHYGENPICNLCNYQTYVLYHLPNLSKLDTLYISDDAKAFADATFMKKRMYYNMRIKTIQRNASNIMKLLKVCKKIRNFKIDIQVTKLTKKLNEIARELEERQHLNQTNKEKFDSVFSYGALGQKKNPLDDIENEKLMGDLENKRALIQGRMHDKNEDLKDLETIYEGLRKKVYEMSEQNIHRLMTELETGGNIRFEEGKPTDKWFSSCVDLVRSRFNPEQMKFFGINGINVTRVTRIHNRFLRNRFEEKLEQLVDLSDNSYKRSLEYLFYGVDPNLPNEIHRAMEEGFRTPQEYQEIGGGMLPSCVSLVNSVASAEIARINSFFQAEDGYAHIRTAAKAQKQTEFRMSSELTLSKGLVQIPSGQLLVCKVFLSKCIPDSNFPYFNPSHSPSEIWRYAPVDTKQLHGVQSVFRTKENDQKQRMWFVLDNALVLPEYLVEFEYISGATPQAPPKGSTTDPLKKPVDSVDIVNEECNKLLAAVNSAQRVLENTYIRHAQREASRLQSLSLTSLDLDRSDMGCLKKTIVNFMRSCHIEELLNNNYQFLDDETTNSAQLAIENSMPPDIPVRSKVDDINETLIVNICRDPEFMQITYLNLFSNRIKKIKCLEKLLNLQTLILSFNEIEQIEGLPIEGRALRRLDLNHNFIRRIEGLDSKAALQNLNLTNNWISDINQIEHLKTHCPQLRELSLKCNPIAAKKSYRPTVFQRISGLIKLDGIALTDKDKERVKNDHIVLTKDIISESIKGAGTSSSNKQSTTVTAGGTATPQTIPQTPLSGSVQDSQVLKTMGSNVSASSGHKGVLQSQQSMTLTKDQLGVDGLTSVGGDGESEATKQSTTNMMMMGGQWEKNVETLGLNHRQISRLDNSLELFLNLRKLQLVDNCISKIDGLGKCKLLEEVSLEKNKISVIENIGHLKYLKKLDLGRNRIRRIDGLAQLENLTQLSMEDNEIQQLDGLEGLQTLMELYLGNNLISDVKEIVKLKQLSRLIILDISGNNLARDQNYRIYCIFHLRKLKVLDGVSIEQAEHMDAKETFAGRLTEEILESRLGPGRKLSEVKELDLSSCRLRDFDNMFDESLYPNLRDLNLSHNSLVTLRGFGYLPKLRILKIKANRLETLFCKPNDDGYPKGLFGLPGLEVLDVSYNNLHDLYGLQYSPLKDLKILNASNNDIVKVDFLEKLKALRELDLSKNRIRQLDATSFSNFHVITCLRLEDNGLRNLQNVEKLERLQSLFVSGNRIPEFWEVDRLSELPHLMEISLMNNPVSRKPNYRTAIIKRLPALIVLDGKEITPEERMRIEQVGGMMPGDPKAPPMIHFAQYPTVKVPVKLNAVNFDGVFNNIKAFSEATQGQIVGTGGAQSQQIVQQMTGKNAIGVVGAGIGIAGVGIGGYVGGPGSSMLMMPGGNSDMGSLIQVNQLQMGAANDFVGVPATSFQGGAGNSRLEDKNSATRRPSTKNNGQGTSQSQGPTGTSQTSISNKDSNKGIGFSALASGVPKTLYGGVPTGASSANPNSLRPPIAGQGTGQGARYGGTGSGAGGANRY